MNTVKTFTSARIVAGAIASALLLAACAAPAANTPTPVPPPTEAPTPMPSPAQPDIVDTAVSAGSFATLVSAVEAAGLVETLKGEGPFTVFAPTDEAFAKLPEGVLEALLQPENKDALTAILTYHVVAGKLMAADVTMMSSATTVQGGSLTIKVEGSTVSINDAKVVQADVEASNGVIHVIDSVLLPPDLDLSAILPKPNVVELASSRGDLKTLVAAVEAAGLVDTLKGEGPFTIFAPTDEAFAKLRAGTLDDLLKPENKDTLIAILTYHVVPGKLMAADVVNETKLVTVQGEEIAVNVMVEEQGVMLNESTVITADLEASNGVIHVIDTVLLPPSLTEAAEPTDILEIAKSAGSFNTLIAAVEAAGLVDTLKGEGPFTVFAPTDEAFAKLPAGTLDDLLKPENKDRLIAILTYHVVSGKVMAADVVKLTAAKTVEGSEIKITVDGNTVKVDDATVVQTDIEASNGVIHVIDAVILPPALR